MNRLAEVRNRMKEAWLRVARRILEAGPHLLVLVLSFELVVLITTIQYARFGTARFLGWDSPYYVYQAVLLEAHGFPAMASEWGYPNLYVVLLWGLGKAMEGPAVAERVLPFVWLLLLLAAYQSISWRLTHDYRISALTTVLAAVSLGTLRIFSDLNRQLMAYSLALIAIVVFARYGGLRPLPRSVLMFVLLLAILSIHVETFAVLGVTLLGMALIGRNPRFVATTAALVATPVALLSPWLVHFVGEYPPTLAFPGDALRLDPLIVTLFVGSVAGIPFLLAGILRLWTMSRSGNPLARLIVVWSAVLAVAAAVLGAGIVPLPAVRAIYILPLPLFLALGVPGVERIAKKYIARAGSGTV